MLHINNNIRNNGRRKVLDGFRALCILAVITFHYFVRYTSEYSWVNLYPYRSAYFHIYFFRFGYLGVHCFFIISGFVIFMTLERSSNIGQFAVKRFIRLWPTLLICSLVTFAVLSFLPLPQLPTAARFFFSTLTITQPRAWEKLFNLNSMNFIDGVEWSLVCELSFYIIAASLYFINKKYFFRNWLIAISVLLSLHFSLQSLGLNLAESYLKYLLFPEYMVMFTIGIYFYLLYTAPKLNVLYHISTAILFGIQLFFIQNFKEDIFIVAFVLLFLLFIYKPVAVAFFSNKVIARIGFISYTIYLLHSSIGIVLINRFSAAFKSTSVFVTVVPTIIVVLAASVFIDRVVTAYVNPYLKKKLLSKA